MLSHWPRFLEIVRGASQFLNTTTFYGHNDADLLQLGNGDLKDLKKARSYFALWAVMKSPLLLATNITTLVNEHADVVEVIKNPYLHAFNQDDEHGGPALPFNWTDHKEVPQFWKGPLMFDNMNGLLVLMLNVDKGTKEMGFNYTQLGLAESAKYGVVDAWNQSLVAQCQTSLQYSVPVEGNDTAVYFVKPC